MRFRAGGVTEGQRRRRKDEQISGGERSRPPAVRVQIEQGTSTW